MKLAHFKKVIRDGKPVLEGTTRYAIPKDTPVIFKRCSTHKDCYVLWSLEKRNSTAHKGSGEF